MELTDKQLLEITGGFKIGIACLVGSIFAFMIGVIDGYIHPKKCK